MKSSRRSSLGKPQRVKRQNIAEDSPDKDSISSPTTKRNSTELTLLSNPRKSIIASVKDSDDIKSYSSDSQVTVAIPTSLQSNINNTRRNSSYGNSSEDADREWTVNDFTLGKPIGKGKFGQVYAAKQKSTNQKVALKVLFKIPMQSANCIDSLRREVEIQCRLKHSNIVQLHGYFQDIKNVYLILEYIEGGDLFKYIQSNGGKVSEDQCRHFMKDISSALHYMHLRHVIHRDIKPENILILKHNNALKLADFGLSVHALPPLHSQRYTYCGTLEYMSPEMCLCKDKTRNIGHNLGVDLWALGILMYEMLLGITPFNDIPREISQENEDKSLYSQSTNDNEANNTENKANNQIKANQLNSIQSDEKESEKLAQLDKYHRIFERILNYDGHNLFPSCSESSTTSRRSYPKVIVSNTTLLSEEVKEVIQSLLKPVATERMTSDRLLQTPWMLKETSQ